jgi:hypothetical protein
MEDNLIMKQKGIPMSADIVTKFDKKPMTIGMTEIERLNELLVGFS